MTLATIRRWHFYAGLFCIPFVLWLSLTGAIYLFRPQVEALIDRPYAHVAGAGPRATAAAQAVAAVRAVPGSVLRGYQLPDTPEQAVQVVVARGARAIRVYVHPQTLAVLKVADEDRRPMRVVFRLHGELLAGDVGSYVVEIAASWTIVMLLIGLVLWWPRDGGLAGTLYPRVRSGGRRFWRDLHAVTGVWVSASALFLLVSGLPWTASWGSYLKAVRTVAEGRATAPDWPTAHVEHAGMAMAMPTVDVAALDRVIATVRPLALAAPVVIAPPATRDAAWTAKSDAADRPRRADLTLAADGTLLSRRDFAQRRLIDRLVGWGVAIHEGQAFGWANVLLNLLTALGLMLLAASSVVLWWRRRPAGVLGAPAAPRHGPAAAVVGAVAVLGMLLPLFGATLVAVLAIERVVLRRIEAVSRWLGLTAKRPAP